MADPKYVNLTAPAGGYESQLADIARRQKLAELLAQQGGEDIKVESVNGVPTPISPFQGLAKVLQSGMGAYLSGKAAADEAALKKAEREAAREGMKLFYELPEKRGLVTSEVEGTKPYQATFQAPTLPGMPAPDAVTAELQMPVGPQTEVGMIPGGPRSRAEQVRMANEFALGDNAILAKLGPALLAQTKPEFEGIGARGTMDTNPDSPTYGTVIGAPPKELEAPKTAGGLQWTPGEGWTEIPGYTEQAKQLAEARHITIENPNNVKLSPDDLDFMANQALAGDTSVFAGLGYGPSGAANRVALRSRMTKRAKELNMSGGDIAAINAQFFGTKAGERTLGTRTANIGMAVAEANQLMPLALAASEKVNRTQFPTLNSIIMAGEKGVGNPDVVRLGIATNSLINTYARAINPTGIPTVSDKDHARELLANAWSKGQYAAGVNQLKLEMDAAKGSPGIVREEFRSSVPGASARDPSASNRLTEADIQNSMKKNNKTRQQVIDFAKSKGYEIAP